ncbi:MAG TPA: DUF3054 domain-containing protein [Chloroflexota bacterium]|nr:DUF3054 domain-containing protein [Chloroflexota bacterium]
MANTTTPAGTAPYTSRTALLALGDTVALLAFAAIGRSNHGEAVSPGDVIGTALPFLAAWFVVASLIGALGRPGSAQSTQPGRLLPRAALAWIIAVPLALVIRGIAKGEQIQPAFAVVALLFNGLTLLGWRGLVSWLAWRGAGD